ncbi:MAG: DUF2235 domain-containing protein [Rhodobacteraceae bacterium]|nr:DUF2235 domain-containing protein [Paracoccaceae bacterium]
MTETSPEKIPPRRLIVCMDGTNNEVGDRQTNVVRLYRALAKNDRQVCHYVQGVGTMDGQELRQDTAAQRDKITGLAFGKGLEDDVLDAYRFLSRTYDFSLEGEERDLLYFIGFSRGAYAARVLAGFINDYGLLHPHELHMAPQIFRAYRQMSDTDPKESTIKRFGLLRRYMQVFEPRQPGIRALILFDTVASMIRFRRPWANFWKYQSPIEFGTHHSMSANPSVKHVLHAVSIDEKRSFFRPLLWTDDPQQQFYYGSRFKNDSKKEPQTVRQVWFAGFHGDIGGSAREDRSGLGKVTINWMVDQLKELQEPLEFRRSVINKDVRGRGKPKNRKSVDGRLKQPPDYGGHIHNSMSLAWGIMEWVPKTIKRRQFPKGRKGLIWWYLPRSEPRRVPDDHPIHPAAFDRREDGRRAYRPVNIAHRERDDLGSDLKALHNPNYSSRSERGGDPPET